MSILAFRIRDSWPVGLSLASIIDIRLSSWRVVRCYWAGPLPVVGQTVSL